MTKKQFATRFVFGPALMLTMAATVLAQLTTGSIRGTVLDPSGALVPQASVTISDENGFSRTIKTNATGEFEAPHLLPGTYSVSVDATGFTPALEGEVKVSDDKVTNENITLRISVDQEVDVIADAI